MKDFLPVPHEIAKRTDLTPSSKLCYGRIIEYLGHNEYAFPSVETLGNEIGLKPRQAANSLKELKQAGLIISIRRGFKKTNLYKLSDMQYSAVQEVQLSADRKESVKEKRKDKDLKDNGVFPEKKEKPRPIFFETFCKDFAIEETEAKKAINYFLEKYKKIFLKPHHALRPETWQWLLDTILYADDEHHQNELCSDDLQNMIDKYFTIQFADCDYSIVHFNQERVKANRFYETCY